MDKQANDADLGHLPSWRAMHADTAPWAEKIQLKFFREASPSRKLELAGELTRGMVLLAEKGLENRHPQASTSELRRRLADILLGPSLAALVYGKLEDSL